MKEYQWLLCPVCNSKTRLKVREDTELKNFPMFCPKCKQEILIDVQQMNISVIKEPITRRTYELLLSVFSLITKICRMTTRGESHYTTMESEVECEYTKETIIQKYGR